MIDILGRVEIFGQLLEWHDLAIVGLLVVLEGVLSIDNALVLGLLAKRLPKHQQSRALTYGLVGAFFFRFIAIGLAAYLLHWRVVKLLGGGYLVYVAVKHFFFENKDGVHDTVAVGLAGEPTLVDSAGLTLSTHQEQVEIQQRSPLPLNYETPRMTRALASFWPTVVVIELTDIAFAVDSILAAVGVVGSNYAKLWIIITGGFLGVVLMRFAAVVFIRLLEKFPRFETSAYLLVIVIGGKLVLDWAFNAPPAGMTTEQMAKFHGPLDFHQPSSPAFWIFWIAMVLCFCVGFIPKRKPATA